MLVGRSHVAEDRDLGWDLTLSGPSLGQKSSQVRRVDVRVVVRVLRFAVDVVDGRVMEVVRE